MKMKEIKNLRMNDELKVIKSLYYMSDDCLSENEWYSKEELFEGLCNIICEGDIWKVIGFDGDKVELECIDGEMEGEFSGGWFDLENVYDKNCFELI
jgi:hypothetical protein